MMYVKKVQYAGGTIKIWDILDMGANLIFFLWYGAKKSRVIDTDFNTLIWGHFRIYMFDMGSCFCPFIRYGVKKVQKCHFIRYGVFCFSLIWGRNHFVLWYRFVFIDGGHLDINNSRYGVKIVPFIRFWVNDIRYWVFWVFVDYYVLTSFDI